MNCLRTYVSILAFGLPFACAASAQAPNPFQGPDPLQANGPQQANGTCPALTVNFELNDERVVISLDKQNWTVTIDGEVADAKRLKLNGRSVRLFDEYGSAVVHAWAMHGGLSLTFLPQVPKRAYLGIDLKPISDVLASQLDLDSSSVSHIVGVRPNSPAQDAGLKENDILLAIDGKEIATNKVLRATLKKMKPKSKLKLKVLRRGKVTKVEVTLGAIAGSWSSSFPYDAWPDEKGGSASPDPRYLPFSGYREGAWGGYQWLPFTNRTVVGIEGGKALLLPGDSREFDAGAYQRWLYPSQADKKSGGAFSITDLHGSGGAWYSGDKSKAVDSEKARLEQRIEKLQGILKQLDEKPEKGAPTQYKRRGQLR